MRVSDSALMFIDRFAELSAQAIRGFMEQNREKIARCSELFVERLNKGGKIVFFGNGGSAADAQHLATEFVGRCFGERSPLAAIALTTDTSCLTALANDYGYDEIFARQCEALVKGEDVVVGISTSGMSKNVLKGLQTARAKGAATVGLAGRGGGKMGEICDHLFVAPTESTQIIQQIHITCGHILVGLVEKSLFGAPEDGA